MQNDNNVRYVMTLPTLILQRKWVRMPSPARDLFKLSSVHQNAINLSERQSFMRPNIYVISLYSINYSNTRFSTCLFLSRLFFDRTQDRLSECMKTTKTVLTHCFAVMSIVTHLQMYVFILKSNFLLENEVLVKQNT